MTEPNPVFTAKHYRKLTEIICKLSVPRPVKLSLAAEIGIQLMEDNPRFDLRLFIENMRKELDHDTPTAL